MTPRHFIAPAELDRDFGIERVDWPGARYPILGAETQRQETRGLAAAIGEHAARVAATAAQ